MIASNASTKSLLEISDTLACLQVEIRKPPSNATDADLEKVAALLPRLLSCSNKLATEQLRRLQPVEKPAPTPQPSPSPAVGGRYLTPAETQQYERLRRQEQMIADTEASNALYRQKAAATNQLRNFRSDLDSLENDSPSLENGCS